MSRLLIRHTLNFIKLYRWSFLVAFVVGIGMILRIHNGDYYPIYQNDDSVFYVWLGNSILDDFLNPTSLSIFDTDNPTMFWRSQYRDFEPVDRFGFKLTEKYFDHPFLASVFISLPSRYFGFTDFEQIPQMIVKIPAFIAAFLALIMTYVVGARLFSKRVGFLSLVFLSFWPHAVFAHRQGYLENFITPALLLVIFGLYHYSQSQQAELKTLIVILAGCIWASWTKLAGYILFFLSMYWMLLEKNIKWFWLMTTSSILSLTTYLIYGVVVGGDHFWWSLLSQGDRGSYLASINHYFSNPFIQHEPVDGWWYLGLIGLGVAMFEKRNSYRLLSLSTLLWLFMTFFLAGEQNTSPWYIYPVLPMMMISLAALFYKALEHGSFAFELVFIMLSLGHWHSAHIDPPSSLLRLVLFIYLVYRLAIAYLPSMDSGSLRRMIMIGVLLLGLVGNIVAIRTIPENVCGEGGCPQPRKVLLDALP